MFSPQRITLAAGLILLAACALAVMPPAACASEKPIATLTDFTGEVLVRVKGDYGKDPMVGLVFYPGDNIVTRVGEATVTYSDGSVLRIQKNSNLTMEEWEEEEGWFKKVVKLKRRLTLAIGKMSFVTGRGRIAQTMLATPTAVCGLRGTAGVISINEAGEPYIEFSEGGVSFTIGDFFTGLAPDVSQSVADANGMQKAAWLAAAAADQLQNAQAQADLATNEVDRAKALAAKAAAEAVLAIAQTMMAANPDQSVVEAYQNAASQAQQQIDEARGLLEGLGEPASPTGGPPATPGFNIPESPPVQDTNQQVQDTRAASPS